MSAIITKSPIKTSQSTKNAKHLNWSANTVNVKTVSFNDHSTINTDFSDHCDTCPEASDLELCPQEGSDSLCFDFLEGYCKKGRDCDFSHTVADAKQHKNILFCQYPECLVLGLKRMKSFLQ